MSSDWEPDAMNAITDPEWDEEEGSGSEAEEPKKERYGRYVDPEERAARMVRAMDRLLRKGPSKGMKYRKWQTLAYYEAVDEIKRAEMAQKSADSLAKSAFLALGIGLGTIAFWAMVVILGNQLHAIGIGIALAVGGWLYWRLSKTDWFS
jgi:hypothetical protein